MDPWSVFDDNDTPTSTTATPEPVIEEKYNSPYGPKFLSSFKDETVEFIQAGLNQMCKGFYLFRFNIALITIVIICK